MLTKLVEIRAAALVTSDSAVGSSELDLGPYINAGKRQVLGVWAGAPNQASTDTDCTYDNKIQESATTVDSDFGDCTSGAFTQILATDTIAFQSIAFAVSKRYVRAYPTLAGTVPKIYSFTGLIVTPRFDT